MDERNQSGSSGQWKSCAACGHVFTGDVCPSCGVKVGEKAPSPEAGERSSLPWEDVSTPRSTPTPATTQPRAPKVQEKKEKRVNPWWIVAISAVLVIAIVLGVVLLTSNSGGNKRDRDDDDDDDAPSTTATLKRASNALKNMYEEDEGKETSNHFSLASQVVIGKTTFTVIWTCDIDIDIIYNVNTKMYDVILPEQNAERREYALMATLTDSAGKTTTLTFTRVLPIYDEILDAGQTPGGDTPVDPAPSEEVYTREGDYIYFGEYPQTIKAEGVTITDTQDSRGYFLGSDGAYYAKVVASPYGSSYTFSNSATVTEGNTYCFKVEPIRWRILAEENGTALILCDSIIANMAYDAGSNNNYAESDIRAWLNAEFYNTAFTDLQKDIILTTTVDNSAESTGDSSNPYACENTEDKVFLLSCKEATNSDYGLGTSADREMTVNDFARATGALMSTSTSYYGNGYWWLRSPDYISSSDAWLFGNDGSLYYSSVDYSNRGVVPVLQIRLDDNAGDVGDEPAPSEEVYTIVDALAIALAKDHNTYTIEKYLIQGVITEVQNTTYGNVIISDGTNSILVYGMYSADGSVRYDAMTTKPVVGDTITVMGVLGQYNGTAQMKNGWLQELVPGEGGGDTPVDPDVPVDPTELTTIVDALAIALAKDHNTYTIEKYLIQGVITEVQNTTYGNVIISDGTNSILVYGMYSADGSVRYDAMTTKPVVGDTITVMGVLGQYNGTAQMKNGWLQELVPGEGGGDTPVDPAPSEEVYTREGDYIYFGEYPQTLKADNVIITSSQDSRGYFLGSDGAYYAKVVADPYGSDYTFSNNATVTEGTTYYFKVEPIRWRILSESDGTALILCDSILTNMAYDAGNNNNYAESDIRAWLNAEFYNTAFTDLQKNIILTTTVDNSAASTSNTSNPYACENTEDKVFLLSYVEAINSAYGLGTSADREMTVNDYARATGAYMSTYYDGYWWLRSPRSDYSSDAWFVCGGFLTYTDVDHSYFGVVPALQIRL